MKTVVVGGKGMAPKAEKQPHDQRKADRVNQRTICLEGLLHEIMNFRARARSDSESREQSSACLIHTCARNGTDECPIAPPVITSLLSPQLFLLPGVGCVPAPSCQWASVQMSTRCPQGATSWACDAIACPLHHMSLVPLFRSSHHSSSLAPVVFAR